MTLTVDEKRSVVLPNAQPGDRFELNASADGKLVLTPVAPLGSSDQKPNVQFVRRKGHLVGIAGRPISSEQVKAALVDFP